MSQAFIYIYLPITLFFSVNFALDYYLEESEKHPDWSVEIKFTNAALCFAIVSFIWPLVVLRRIWNLINN
jgi:hypothetical protein